jgi:hypothetical protein
MKYIKKFEELSIGTYANLMDRTEGYPFTDFAGNKVKADKMNRINNYSNKRFQEEFYKLYPKNQTKITFKDRESTHELSFDSIKFNTNYTNYDLIFKTEAGKNVWISNPFYIEPVSLDYISILPVQIEPKSKELVNKMFNYGFSGEKIQ